MFDLMTFNINTTMDINRLQLFQLSLEGLLTGLLLILVDVLRFRSPFMRARISMHFPGRRKVTTVKSLRYQPKNAVKKGLAKNLIIY